MEQILEQQAQSKNGAVGRSVASQDVELERIALERHKLNFEIKYALDKDLDFRAVRDEIRRAQTKQRRTMVQNSLISMNLEVNA